MDYKDVFGTIVNGLVRYIKDNGLKSLVLGLSGGIDSTLCAIICNEACKQLDDVKFIGVSLPSSTNKDEENDIATEIGSLCTHFVKHPINSMYDAMKKEIGMMDFGNDTTPLQDGNIKARLRMICLYNTASIYHGIVIDTDNLTEHYLGFYTVHGDVGDVAPLGNLWKTEVYELANWCLLNLDLSIWVKKALLKSINIVPTDGNGVKDGGDLAQIAPGLTYADVDKILKNEILYTGLWTRHNKYNLFVNEYGKDIVEGVISRYKNSRYKRENLPVVLGNPINEIDIMS